MAANWSELPRELLFLILEKLSLTDHIRFSSVCTSWNLVIKENIHGPKPQSPWLMLPGDDNTSANFFSPSESRTYRIPLPLPLIRRRICIGSSFGWLITVDDVCEMYLLNPLTGAQIRLPSITTLPSVDAVPDPHGRPNKLKFLVLNNLPQPRPQRAHKNTVGWMHRCFFRKAVLSSPPSPFGEGFTVMLIHGTGDRLAFARAGDKAWTSIRKPHVAMADIIRHRGRFYTVSTCGMLEVWEEDGHDFEKRTITGSLNYDYIYVKYLVANLAGQLMMILRDRQITDGGTTEIQVLVFDEKQCDWFRVKDLRNNVVFIGNNHSMCVSLIAVPELRPNCVYFTDDDIEFTSIYRHSRRDIGAFDIKDESVKSVDSLGPHLNWPLPIWVTPTLH